MLWLPYDYNIVELLVCHVENGLGSSDDSIGFRHHKNGVLVDGTFQTAMI